MFYLVSRDGTRGYHILKGYEDEIWDELPELEDTNQDDGAHINDDALPPPYVGEPANDDEVGGKVTEYVKGRWGDVDIPLNHALMFAYIGGIALRDKETGEIVDGHTTLVFNDNIEAEEVRIEDASPHKVSMTAHLITALSIFAYDEVPQLEIPKINTFINIYSGYFSDSPNVDRFLEKHPGDLHISITASMSWVVLNILSNISKYAHYMYVRIGILSTILEADSERMAGTKINLLSWMLSTWCINYNSKLYIVDKKTAIWNCHSEWSVNNVVRTYVSICDEMCDMMELSTELPDMIKNVWLKMVIDPSKAVNAGVMKSITFEEDPFVTSNIIAFANGIITTHDDTLIIRKIQPSDMITPKYASRLRIMDKSLVKGDVLYQGRAEYEKFIRQVFPDDGVRETVFRMLASIFCLDRLDKKFFCMVGYGGNEGKSTFCKVVRGMIGIRAAEMNEAAFTSHKDAAPNSHTAHLMCLLYAALCFVSEAQTSEWNMHIVKGWTGGDHTKIRGAHQREDLEIPVLTRFCSVGNKMPSMPPDSRTADYNRFLIIPCISEFTDYAPKSEKEQWRLHKFPMKDLKSAEFSRHSAHLLTDVIECYPRYIKNRFYTTKRVVLTITGWNLAPHARREAASGVFKKSGKKEKSDGPQDVQEFSDARDGGASQEIDYTDENTTVISVDAINETNYNSLVPIFGAKKVKSVAEACYKEQIRYINKCNPYARCLEHLANQQKTRNRRADVNSTRHNDGKYHNENDYTIVLLNDNRDEDLSTKLVSYSNSEEFKRKPWVDKLDGCMAACKLLDIWHRRINNNVGLFCFIHE